MLGRLADGTPVYDREDSHLLAHEEARPWLEQALARLSVAEFTDGTWAGVCDLGQVIGVTTCVAVGPADDVLYARRHGRQGWSRFVRGRTGEPCSTLKMVLRWHPEQKRAILRTAFVGQDSPPEPWSSGAQVSPEAYLRSRHFWSEHALLWDDTTVDPAHPVHPMAPPDYWGQAPTVAGGEVE